MTHPKAFVLDTNVLLNDPNSIHKFEENLVVIPITVIEELDNHKKGTSDIARNAREVIRVLDKYRKTQSLVEGVTLRTGGFLRVEIRTSELPESVCLNPDQPDARILATTLFVKSTATCPVTLVTRDVNLRIRADILGIASQDYKAGIVKIENLYQGTANLTMPSDTVDALYSKDGWDYLPDDVNDSDVVPNQYLVVKDLSNPKHTSLGRVSTCGDKVQKLSLTHRGDVWGIKPRNKEQHFALDALLDPEIQVVTLVGHAGTGKTLLAAAAGLELVTESKLYDKLLVARPVIPLGKDIGYLPGTLEEKMNPWMQPIFDNVEFLMGISGQANRSYQELIHLGILQVEPLTYIRGRSIPRQFILLDEAQNLSPLEVKTIITRAGEGTKIVLTGDPYQIDNPHVDAQSNGLTYVVEKFKGQKLAATVSLIKGERSPLAELAARLL